jgi:uncharacterized protein (TIGR03086 family)
MNISMLHKVTEDLAAYWSKVTEDDLERPTPCAGWTVGDLYRHVVEENTTFGHAISGLPVPLTATTDYEDAVDGRPARRLGSRFEEIYRASARYMETAFAAVDDPDRLRQVAGIPGERPVADLFEMQIADTVIHTWDLAQALSITYEPQAEIADLVLRRMQSVPDVARGEGKPFGAVRATPDAEVTALDRIVLLSGRDLAWRADPPRPRKEDLGA